jgi:hypothetical protein
MVSTVTTTTIMTVNTAALAATLTLLLLFALLMCLVQKDIVSTATSPRARALSRVLNVAILPLLFSFLFIAAVKIAGVLN